MTIRPIDNILSTADLKRTAEHLSADLLSDDTMRRLDARLSDQIKITSPHSGYFIMSSVEPGSVDRQYKIIRYEVQEYIRAKDGRICDRLVLDTINDESTDMKAAKRVLKAV